MNPDMPTESSSARQPFSDPTEAKLKIYFLPNLLTAGNLFCGFVALTKIVEANLATGDFHNIKVALGFILLACIFDLFDGRVARMGGIGVIHRFMTVERQAAEVVTRRRGLHVDIERDVQAAASVRRKITGARP